MALPLTDRDKFLILAALGLPESANRVIALLDELAVAVTAASATAGANGAVPAQVAGYIVINVNGVNQKLPYYNV